MGTHGACQHNENGEGNLYEIYYLILLLNTIN